MLKELLEKLEGQHGIPQEQGTGIINTIVQHIKDNFPMVGGMLDSVMGGQNTSTTASQNGQVTPVNESPLQKLEDLAKSKMGGLFGG